MKDMTDIPALMAEIGQRAKTAAAELAFAPAEVKRAALEAAADAVWARRAQIVEENAKDIAFGRDKGLSDAMMDRLKLDEDRIQGICDGLRAVAAVDHSYCFSAAPPSLALSWWTWLLGALAACWLRRG